MPDDRVTLPSERLTSAKQVDKLQAAFGLEGRLNFFVSELGGVVAKVTTEDSDALIALQGAQVLSWIPQGYRETLWLSPDARLGTGKAVRGGIPVCWPWFGAHPCTPSKPSHGVARTAVWDIAGSALTQDGVVIKFRLPDANDTATGLSARLEVTVGPDLGLALLTRNTGQQTVQLTQALHSYFLVGDIDDVSIAGLEGCAYIDALAEGLRRQQSGLITIGEEVDRIYQGVSRPVVIHDGRLRRRIEIENGGSQSCIVWNPWIAKSERLGDMGPQGYRAMVCVETANAGDDTVQLKAGAEHELRAKIGVKPML